MDIKEYYKAAKRTMNPDLTWEQLKNHALHGIASECGEIHGLYQKTYQGHEITKERVIDEIGDLCWFIMELCYAEHIDPEAMLEYNVDKLVTRFPDGFSIERSVHRKEYEHG